MEDASLDDFFAKKDKSKKKSKSSKLPSGDILEKTDEPVKKEKKKKVKEKSYASTNNDNDSTIGKTEEEWKDAVEEEVKDYSGLRIANLQVPEKELEESEELAVEDEVDDEEGDGKKRKDGGQQGPWIKSDGTSRPRVAPKPTEPVTDEAPKVEVKATPTGKYIPPSQRAAAAAAASGISVGPTIPAHLRRKKAAPNIKSEDDFPTLGGGVMPFHQDSDSRIFERVHHGGRQSDDSTKTSQQLSLGNKFSALQD